MKMCTGTIAIWNLKCEIHYSQKSLLIRDQALRSNPNCSRGDEIVAGDWVWILNIDQRILNFEFWEHQTLWQKMLLVKGIEYWLMNIDQRIVNTEL